MLSFGEAGIEEGGVDQEDDWDEERVLSWEE